MAYEFIPIVDGDSLTAGGLKGRFTSIETEINALDQTNILPRSLDQQHVASQVLLAKDKSIPSGGGTHIYSNKDPFPSASVTEDTSLAPIGWYIIRTGGQTSNAGTAGTGDKLELYFGSAGSFTVGDSANAVGGILVMANIQVNQLHWTQSGLDSLIIYRRPELYGKFAFQVRGNGTWHHLTHTERFIETDTVNQLVNTGIVKVHKDVSMRAMVPESSYIGAIDAVRVVCCTRQGGLQTPYPLSMVLQHCNLSVMVFHGHMRAY